MDWLNSLDIDQAVKNCSSDIIKDWHRDPWGWPETGWAMKADGSQRLVQRLNSDRVGRSALLDVPKENFVLRPALVLDPIDRLIYEALVDKLSHRLLSSTPDWAYGWRLDRNDPAPGHYANRRREWDLYRDHLEQLADRFSCALETDIVSFFSSVPLNQLVERVQQLTGTRSDLNKRLVTMLESWNQIPGRSGLPQRCNASSVLADMYLRPVDDVLREFGRYEWLRPILGREVAAARWMDDILLFGDDPSHLRRAQMEIQAALHSLGLNINASKTRVLEGDEMVAQVKNLEHSAVDGALNRAEPDNRPLTDLIWQIVQSPETTPATSIKFATKRMRDHGLFQHEQNLVEVSPRMPHASPDLARLFRSSGSWRDLVGWFTEYADSDWGQIDWAVASFGTMFPSGLERAPAAVSDVLAKAAQSRGGLSLFAIVCQRLTAWNPDNARRLFREVAKLSSDPHQRRVLALAGLSAGEEVSWVKAVLSEFEENTFTLGFVESRGFQPPKVVRDFSGEEGEQ